MASWDEPRKGSGAGGGEFSIDVSNTRKGKARKYGVRHGRAGDQGRVRSGAEQCGPICDDTSDPVSMRKCWIICGDPRRRIQDNAL